MSRGTTRDENGLTVVPGGGAHSGETLSQIRAKLSGLHFAQEALSDGEREILHLAEALLAIIDHEDPSGYRH